MDSQILLVVLLVAVVGLAALIAWLVLSLRAGQDARHRAVLTDLHEGLAGSADRIASRQSEEGDRLRREIGDQSQRQQLLFHSSMGEMRSQIQGAIESLTKGVDTRLAEIGGKVSERLDEGFKKTNETFVNVMTRLQTIDDAQKKIETLTSNVVSLQQLLGDKRSRGAFGERQLEDIVRNMLPESAFEMQYTFAKGVRADCVLKLPEPTGLIAVDSKFPLENYEKMISEGTDKIPPGAFKADVKKHVDDIASKYIIPGETSDGAVMFLPAEAVFAEIHAHHRDLVEYAQARRVWIVSPTTMMAVLNTARAVLKDVETRKQIHIIKDELGKLGKEFSRFDERMKKLADHIRQANDDATQVQITSRKISERFATIERAELPGVPSSAPPSPPEPPTLTVVPKND
jgi:DNA recombination protein RmuC